MTFGGEIVVPGKGMNLIGQNVQFFNMKSSVFFYSLCEGIQWIQLKFSAVFDGYSIHKANTGVLSCTVVIDITKPPQADLASLRNKMKRSTSGTDDSDEKEQKRRHIDAQSQHWNKMLPT